jgi:hypothetical protein
MVVVEKLSKDSHFILVKSICKEIKIAKIFMKEIFRLHGMPMEIISDRDAKFTSNFCKYLFEGFETKLIFSTTCFPQTNENTKRLNHVLEDMLRMHVMHQSNKWEDHLLLVEYAYKNGYQESLKMSPFEALHGRQCNIPISWNNALD